MKEITIDLAAARRALRSLTPRTVALIASIPDLDVPIASSDWTVGQGHRQSRVVVITSFLDHLVRRRGV
jgi:hypothetical protein